MKYIPLLLCGLISTSALAQTSNQSYKLGLTSPDKPAQIDISVYYGEVRVEGFDGDHVEVEIEKLQRENPDDKVRSRGGNDADAKPSRSMDGLKSVAVSASSIAMQEHNNQVDISADYSSEYVKLLVRIPKKSSVEAELRSGGSLSLNNIHGALELQTWKSPIDASNIFGPIVAETHDQDIVVTFAGFDQEHPSSLASHSGNIDITLAPKVAAEVSVQTFKGLLYSGLTAEFTSKDYVERQQGREIKVGGRMSAAVNGGGQNLSLNTFSGDIYVRKP